MLFNDRTSKDTIALFSQNFAKSGQQTIDVLKCKVDFQSPLNKFQKSHAELRKIDS